LIKPSNKQLNNKNSVLNLNLDVDWYKPKLISYPATPFRKLLKLVKLVKRVWLACHHQGATDSYVDEKGATKSIALANDVIGK